MSQPTNHVLSVPAAAANGTPDSAPTEAPKRRHTLAAAVEPLLWELPVAAEALAVSTRTLKRMAAAGELPEGAVVRLARRRLFNRRVLERWVETGCPRPARKSGRPR
jgi:excisionase family DNA binding protein